MKQAFSILMITAILLPSLHKIGILIDFKVRQDFIAEALCINKEEPILMCSGKCYLSEQLKKADEQEERQVPTHSNERLEVVHWFFKPSSGLFKEVDPRLSKLNPVYENDFYASTFVADIFHPPQLFLA